MENTKNFNVGEIICQQLKAEERTKKWLADQLCITKSCLCKKLQQRRIYVDMLLQISFILKYDFSSDMHNYYLEYSVTK